MCGIVGIVGHDDVNRSLYDALLVLQHRGQDAAGICTSDRGKFHVRKDNGLVRDVFHTRHMKALTGAMGIGHCRYPTAGCESSAEAQPFYVNSPYGIALAHNGNLTNAESLAREVYESDLRHVNTSSDSEVLLNVFAHELRTTGGLKPTASDVFNAVAGVHRRCRGAYAAVVMITGYGIVGFRDRHGIRPLCLGRREAPDGMEYILASESVAVQALGFEFYRDVEPGEAVYLPVGGHHRGSSGGKMHASQCAPRVEQAPCLFEYVYLARPDSIMDDVSIYKARLRMGERLAEKIKRERPDHGIDVVIPIPDSGRTAALELAHGLGVKFREGYIKNRYIGRTFIMPGQEERQSSVRKKLNPIDLEFRGKHVLLVDDSIVRGTTCRQIIEMARQAGATKVSFASAAPPVRHPNVYGIDMPSAKELIAAGRTDEEIGQEIGADWLIYQDLKDLEDACRVGNIQQFENSVFTGKYVTGDVDGVYLDRLHAKRNDVAKSTTDV